MELLDALNTARAKAGYLTIPEVLSLAERSVVYDPCSLLVSRHAVVGDGNVFYPGVTLDCPPGGRLTVGGGNTFAAGTHLDASGGAITVGDGNHFGDGPVCIKSGSAVTVGSRCRFEGAVHILGRCAFGDGAQVLGAVRVYDCTLAPGGDFREPDPDLRAGVLKGCGTARALTIPQGMVVNGPGHFSPDLIEPQSNYHPKPTGGIR